MSNKTKYQELKELTSEYGKETTKFNHRVWSWGSWIMTAYSEWLEADGRIVCGVPPNRSFRHREEYCGEAFSTFGNRLLFLEPIQMGICTEIGNLGDDGSTFVRTVLEFQPSNSQVTLMVGRNGERFSLGDDIDSYRLEICEAIYEDVKMAFSLDLDEAQGNSRIGFLMSES